MKKVGYNLADPAGRISVGAELPATRAVMLGGEYFTPKTRVMPVPWVVPASQA